MEGTANDRAADSHASLKKVFVRTKWKPTPFEGINLDIQRAEYISISGPSVR